MERFESVIDDVKDITIDIVANGYNDMIPGMCEHLDISATRIGEEEHFYRFTGPGVEKFYENLYRNRPDAKIIMNNEKLRDEQQQLKKENEELWSRIRQFEEMIKKLECDNTLNKETADTWSKEYYNLSKKFDKLQEEYQNLKDDGYSAMIHGKIYNPAQLVDRILELEEGNKDLREEFDKVTKRAEELRKEINESKGLHYPITRERVLDKAKECVCGQREQDYGSPESNFQLIADLWNGYLGNTLSKEKRDFEKELGVTHKHKELSVPWEISAMDVSMMMALLKIARIKNGGGSGDSFVDLAGYAACGGEIWYGERHSDK